MRIFIGQFVEGEVDGREQVGGRGYGLGRIGEQPRHLGGVFQVTLAIGGEPCACFLDRHLLADAGQDVVVGPVGGSGIECVIGGDEGDARFLGEAFECGQPTLVCARPVHRCAKPEMGSPFSQLPKAISAPLRLCAKKFLLAQRRRGAER